MHCALVKVCLVGISFYLEPSNLHICWQRNYGCFLTQTLELYRYKYQSSRFCAMGRCWTKIMANIGISLVGHIYQYLFAVIQGYRSMAAIWRHFIHCISFFIWGIDHPSSMDKPPYYYIAFQWFLMLLEDFLISNCHRLRGTFCIYECQMY